MLTGGKIYLLLKSPGGSLSQRVLHAGFWVFLSRIIDRLFGLTRTVILARLLSPKDFGLFGIALLALSALETFSQTGFETAFIQKKGDVYSYLDTVWTVQLIRGIMLCVLLVLGAPFVATFFGEPKAVMLLRVLATTELLKGFTNSGVLLFEKELEFHKQFVYSFSGTLIDFAVAIPAALILRNAWALVFGLLAAQLTRTLISYFIHPFRPRLVFDWGKAREFHKYGRWVFSSSILVFFMTQGDDILVGRILGVTALGVYQLAYRLSNLPATEITHLITRVTFPAYSKLQDKKQQLNRAYLKTIHAIAMAAFPVTVMIYYFSFDFTGLFLGEKWLSIAPIIRVLVLWGLLRAIGASRSPLFNAIGKPQINTFLQLLQLLLLVVLIYPFTIYWELKGAAFSLVIIGLIGRAVEFYFIIKETRISFSTLVKSLVLPAIASLLMLPSIHMLYSHLGEITPSVFFFLICFGLITYLSFLVALKWLLKKVGFLEKMNIS